jgi:hypothetical protein
MDTSRGWNQAWRGPLREAFDCLRDRAAVFFAEAADDLFADPWQARDSYGEIVDAPPENRLLHLRSLGRGPLGRGQSSAAQRALGLMEMQRSLLLMYASCGWFFDDIAGVESVIVLRRAAHAMDCWRALGSRPPESAFLDILAQAKSNQPTLGTGADVFRRACQARVTPARAVARAAFATLVGPAASREVPASTSRSFPSLLCWPRRPCQARPRWCTGEPANRFGLPSPPSTTAGRVSNAKSGTSG